MPEYLSLRMTEYLTRMSRGPWSVRRPRWPNCRAEASSLLRPSRFGRGIPHRALLSLGGGAGGKHLRRRYAGRHPTRDLVEFEAPHAPNFEAWDTSGLEQTIDRYPMDAQMIRQFGNRKDLFGHFIYHLANSAAMTAIKASNPTPRLA